MARNKYHNKKTTIDGITFDSKLEAARYQELKLLERAGEISDLECQPRFRLIDGQDHNGEHYRPVNYYSDFKYRENGKWICEDVKSKATITPVFKIKQKLWISMHDEKEWEFRVVS